MPTPGARHIPMEIVIDPSDFRPPLPLFVRIDTRAPSMHKSHLLHPLRLSPSPSIGNARFHPANRRAWSSSALVDDARRGGPSITHKSALKVRGQRLKRWTVFLSFSFGWCSTPGSPWATANGTQSGRIARFYGASFPPLFVITAIPLKKIPPPRSFEPTLNHIKSNPPAR